MRSRENILGNTYDKYGTNNPIARRMMRAFLAAVSQLYLQCKPQTVLEVGCGEGRLTNELIKLYYPPQGFRACDLSLNKLDPDADKRIEFDECSIYALPFADDSFDLVVCCEVLEHLEDPRSALRELARVSHRKVIVSTPWEPLWRVLNMLRGKYWSDFGNTPGHLQNFSRRRLRQLVSNEFVITAEQCPIPWTVLMAEQKKNN